MYRRRKWSWTDRIPDNTEFQNKLSLLLVEDAKVAPLVLALSFNSLGFDKETSWVICSGAKTNAYQLLWLSASSATQYISFHPRIVKNDDQDENENQIERKYRTDLAWNAIEIVERRAD
jgi:hypothetical protein